MGTYINLKCGKCKYSFTEGYKRGSDKSKLGLPLIKCPRCGTINNTRCKPWRQLSQYQKFQHWFWVILSGFFLTGGLFLIILILIDTFALDQKIQDYNSNILIYVFLLGAIIGTLFSIKASKQNIKETDEIIRSEEYRKLINEYNAGIEYLKMKNEFKKT